MNRHVYCFQTTETNPNICLNFGCHTMKWSQHQPRLQSHMV
jgi:hypothetical protein